MSKRYSLTRRLDDDYILKDGGYVVRYFAADEPDKLLDLLRTHPDVEDKTKPDWSHVAAGTWGTATVDDAHAASWNGTWKAIKRSAGFWVLIENDQMKWVSDGQIVHFERAVVVNEALIGEVSRAIESGASLSILNIRERVVKVLWSRS